MAERNITFWKFGAATVLIVGSLGFLAYTGVQESKSYYVTIKELRGMQVTLTASACAWPEMYSRGRSSETELASNLFW